MDLINSFAAEIDAEIAELNAWETENIQPVITTLLDNTADLISGWVTGTNSGSD